MEQRSIRQLAEWAGGSYEGPDLPVAGISIDTRTIARGEMFVAVRGARDGHAFVGEAFVTGAAAALVEREDVAAEQRQMGRPVIRVDDARRALARIARRHRDALGLTVVGVTGSVGKTTTKEMLRLVLGAGTVVSPASFNNDLGVPLTLLRAGRHDRVCVVEIGTSAPGEIAALAEIARPDIGVVLNVAEAHLEKLGDLDGVAREKFALVVSLGPEGCAVLNHDDPRTREMMRRAPGFVLGFGTTPEADVYGDPIHVGRGVVSFQLFRKTRVRLHAFGRHLVSNALAAAAVGLWLGRHPCEIAQRLAAFRPAPMRMAVERCGGARLVLDAYNANPRSTVAALRELAQLPGASRRIAVLGDMLELGRHAADCHERIGRFAAGLGLDALWAVGPLSEVTARAARAGGMREVHWAPDVESAAARIPFRPRARDAILFKASRAMRLERLFQEVKAALLERARAREEARARSEEAAPA